MTDATEKGLPPIASRVFEALSRGGALGACELMRRVSVLRSAETPLVSIYRALALLRSRGLVVQSVASKRWALRDPEVSGPALLLVCSGCGAVVQREAAGSADTARALARSNRFRLALVHLEISGLCAGCRADGPASAQKIGQAR